MDSKTEKLITLASSVKINADCIVTKISKNQDTVNLKQIKDLIQQIYGSFSTFVISVNGSLTIKSDRDRKVIPVLQNYVASTKGLIGQIERQSEDLFECKKESFSIFFNELKDIVSALQFSLDLVIETFKALKDPSAPTPKPPAHIPVTVITGFLGSGKTTLLNFILQQNHGKRIAVIENEFGEIDVDSELIDGQFSSNEQIMQMENGCLCCKVRGDLVKALLKLISLSHKFDYILIETTGLADPSPIAQTFWSIPEIQARLRLDSIITLVDSKHILQHLNEIKEDHSCNEAIEQIAFADRIILNKIDLVELDLQNEVIERINQINKGVQIKKTKYSKIDLEWILNIGAFELDRVLTIEPQFLDSEPKPHSHDKSVGSVSFKIKGNVNLQQINLWFGNLLTIRGTDIFRMKGILSIDGMQEKFAFQGVHMLFEGNPITSWKNDEERENKLVFIGRNLNKEEFEIGFRECLVT